MSFGQNVRHQRARALRNMGQTYPPRSADRIAALQKALQLLREALSLTTGTPPLLWELRLDEVVCHRLLEDWTKVTECLAAFPPQDVPVDVAQRKQAEAVRLALATSGPQAALQEVPSVPKTDARSPELDFAHLETAIALWRAAAEGKVEAESAKWRDQAVALVRDIEHRHGSYWGRRADLLLLETGRERGGGSTEILERAANEFYVQGRLDAALSGYDEAAAAALAAGDNAKAFELAYKAALVVQNQSQYQAAADRFRNWLPPCPTRRMPPTPICSRSPIWRSKSASIRSWRKRTPSCSRNIFVCGRPDRPPPPFGYGWESCAKAAQWADAVQAYRQVAVAEPASTEALEGVTRSWLHLLGELQTAQRFEEARDVAEQAAGYLEDTARSCERARRSGPMN